MSEHQGEHGRHEHHDPLHRMEARLDRLERSVAVLGLAANAAMELLLTILEKLTPPPRVAAVTVSFDQEDSMGVITVRTGAVDFAATVKATDDSGAAVAADDVPQWSSSNEAVATVADVAADGLSATIHVVGIGEASIDVASTNRDGTVVHGSGTVTVQGGEPVALDVEFQSA